MWRPTLVVGLCALASACATPADPNRYRLTDSGPDWTVSGEDLVLEDLKPRYPEYFAIVLDPQNRDELDLRPLRDDLEQKPADRHNYDALNAIAIGYFELNSQAEALRGTGNVDYLGGSMQVAKLVAVPWRAYREIEAGELRDAILDFFADAASGEKPASGQTARRLASIVASLEEREADPARQARIQTIVAELQQGGAPGQTSPF